VVLGFIAGMGTLANGINGAMATVSTEITNNLKWWFGAEERRFGSALPPSFHTDKGVAMIRIGALLSSRPNRYLNR
jgi:hypothetical protein